jgi:hypothetical protein
MNFNLKKKHLVLMSFLFFAFSSFSQSNGSGKIDRTNNQEMVAIDSLSKIIDKETIEYYLQHAHLFSKTPDGRSSLLSGGLKKEFMKSEAAYKDYKEYLKLQRISSFMIVLGVTGCISIVTVVATPVVITTIGVAVVVIEIAALKTSNLAQRKLYAAMQAYNKYKVLEAAKKSVL